MRRLTSALVALFAAAWLPGCRCSEDRPYTPFGTTSALPAPEPSPTASALPSASASAPAVAEKSVLAPAGARSFLLGGQTLEAPPGYVFNQALRADFGAGDAAVAWLDADASGGPPRAAGTLWLFSANAPARKLGELPGFVPNGPGCKVVSALSRTGPHSVTLDVRGECQGALIARAPVRALLVLAPAADPPELLSLRVAGPAAGETLELSATTTDRDGDGRDDMAVDVSVASEGTKVSAPLVWLDRAAGRSRDSAEPGRSLVRAAQREAARAKTKKLAEEVPKNVATLRRLMASLCAEGATPRVLDADGSPLSCGSLSSVVDALASAELTAELTRGRVLAAFGVLSRDGWYFGKTSASTRQKLERQLFDAVTPLTAVVTTLEPRPLLERAPRYSPLAFDAAGGVLVQTHAGVVRTQPDGSAPVPVEGGGPPRPLDVLVRPGQRFSGVTFSCDRSEVVLNIEGAPSFTTNLLSPRPGACGHTPFFATSVPPPLAAGGGHLSVLVGGTVVGDAEKEPRPPGSAGSENGRFIVVPSAYGLLIAGPPSRLVNLGPGIAEPQKLTDCVVNEAGDVAACVHKGQALLIRPGSGAAPAPAP